MKLVRIRYHRDGETWWADSTELPGWTAAGESFEEARAMVDDGIRTFVNDDALIVEEGLPVLNWTLTMPRVSGPASTWNYGTAVAGRSPVIEASYPEELEAAAG